MLIGTERVSGTQERMLRDALSHPPPWRLGAILVRLAEDREIQHEEEEVHPQWLELFAECRPLLEAEIPTAKFKAICDFFESLEPIDSAIADIDFTQVRTCFLLGAGASKPSPSDIPTVKELLPQLLERARRLDREDVTRLSDFCEERHINNIEDLLTAAQLATFCSRSPTVLGLVNFLLYGDGVPEGPSRQRRLESAADVASVAFLQDTLQVLFGLLSSTMLPAKPNAAHQAIADYAKHKQGTAIITTNYDCCMDLALGQHGKDFLYQVDFANADEKSRPPRRDGRTRNPQRGNRQIVLDSRAPVPTLITH